MLDASVSNHFLILTAFCLFAYFLLCLIRCRYNESLKIRKRDFDKILQQPEMVYQNQTPSAGSKLVFFGNGDGGYSVKELMHSASKVLWKGTFGTSFKTELKGGNAVMVKRLKGSCSSETEFRERVLEIGILLHENLLPLRAYCCYQNENFLVYDCMRMGSLAKHLHGKTSPKDSPLTWQVRCKIAFGVARAIHYLHTTGSNICHGNIRSSNVLLTDTLDARLSEFGIVRLISPEHKPDLINGYRAPEVRNAHEVSQKSDVYSFGVLLLELLTGIKPVGTISPTTGVYLAEWVRTMIREKPILEVFDDELLLEYQADFEGQMVKLLELAICCTFEYPDRRPLMSAVLKRMRETCSLSSED
ncbi:probable inactive receptor kinase At1g48480 [Coffea arabica]|uniref:Probable inactive receptor kinase At1g48480 n=1 Tax=Coffea arabica TaxID=13443 RepID=A0A6P6V5R5_COFAR|nr:probable inactive receptor kinase At1g48480 [Coffea arabica]